VQAGDDLAPAPSQKQKKQKKHNHQGINKEGTSVEMQAWMAVLIMWVLMIWVPPCLCPSQSQLAAASG
jgi:hypothetical protein